MVSGVARQPVEMAKPSKRDLNHEMGVQIAGLPFSEPFSDGSYGLVRNTEPTVKQLVEMRRNDGQARGLFRLLTMPVRAAAKKVTWVPAEGGEKEAAFAEALLTTPSVRGGMKTSFQQVIAQMLLAVMDGFSPFELVYTVPKKGPLQGKVALSKIAYRPSETIQFLVDDVGDLEGLRQRTTTPGGRYLDVKIEKDYSFFYACSNEENPFYGVSFFNAAFYHYDKKCLVGPTMIPLLDGTEVALRDLVARVNAGEKIWVYSCKDGKVAPGLVRAAQRTGRRKTVKVRLDNDEVICCTPDHLFMMRDGSYREAADLRSDDSLMPLYRRLEVIGKTNYEQVRHPGDSSWQFTHNVVADVCMRPREKGLDYEVVHHQDINPRNNRPDNLQIMTRQAHIKLHASLMKERWKDSAWRDRMMSLEAISKRADGIRRSWAEASPERRAERAAITINNVSSCWRTDVTIESIEAQVRAGILRRLDVANALKTSDVIVLERVKSAGFTGWQQFVKKTGKIPVKGGGRPQRFSIQDIEQAYDTVSDSSGFATLDTLVTKLDCTYGQVYRTLKYNGLGSFAKWRAGYSGVRKAPIIERNSTFAPEAERLTFYNHKVVSVEEGDIEEVYDIEVPGLENFALSAGVFVHNCKLYYLAHLAAQHRAVGSRLGKYPLSATPMELLQFRKALSDFGLAQAMSVPDKGWSVEDLGKSLGDFPFMDFVNHHNSQMSKSVLAPFLDDAQGGQKSIVDFGGQTDSMYQTLISVLISEIETLISEVLVPRFIDWNFNSDKYPQIKFGPFTDEQKHVISTTFEKLATAGTSANVTRTFLLELEKHMAGEMGLEIDYKKITEALKKQEELSLEHFMSEAAPPPMSRPFQAIGTNPADQQQGVSPTAQWLPGPQMPGPQPQPGPQQPSGSPSGPGNYPSLPSQLSANHNEDADFLGFTIVRVDAYTRVRHGQTEHVDGYYYDVQRGVKVSPASVSGRVKKVSIHQAKALAAQSQSKGSQRSLGSQSGPPSRVDQKTPGVPVQKWPVGTYHISLPDGSTTEIIVSKDGSSRSIANGRTEQADSEQTSRFLSYWKRNVEQVDDNDGGLDDVEHPAYTVGGIAVNKDIIQEAIDILSRQSSTGSSTALKAPLKAANHPLADVNLREFAEQHSDGKLHYSKLKQGVIAALQDVLKGESSKKTEDKSPEKPDSSSAKSEESDTPIASLRPGMHLVTEEDHVRLAKDKIKLPPAWTNVQISDDPKAALQAIGIDSKGRSQYVYSSQHTDKQAQAKFARIKALRKQIPKIDRTLKKDASTSDHAAALLLIRRVGLRPGSDTDTGSEKKAFGATNMLVEHVKITDDTVRLTFTGKKGVDLDFTVQDLELASTLASRVEGKSPQDKLFETNERRTAAYLHAIARGFKVKDLRTYYGTMFAFSIVESMSIPKTDAERKKARKEVAQRVSEKLGNTPAVALASYIDPMVFASWETVPTEIKEGDQK